MTIRDDEQAPAVARRSPWAVAAALALALCVTALLTSARMLASAKGLPYGPGRDAAVAAASTVDEIARAGRLDVPAARLGAWLGRAGDTRQAGTDRDARDAEEAPASASADHGQPWGAVTDLSTRTPPGPPTGARGGSAPEAVPEASRSDSATAAAYPASATVSGDPGSAPQVVPQPSRPDSATPAGYPARATVVGGAGFATATGGSAGGAQSGAWADDREPGDRWPGESLRPLGTRVPRLRAPRRVSPQDPLRILVVGDSFAEPLGYEFQAYGRADGMTTTRIDFKIASGLARPDYFDWPARLSELLAARDRVDAVVVFLGGNDDKNMMVGGEIVTMGTTEWRAAYGGRAGALMDLCAGTGARLYWIGLPVMREPERGAVVADINAEVARETRRRTWVTFVDTWAMFADASDAYAMYLPGADGRMERMRADDGVHLTRPATNRVARRAYEAMAGVWDLTPPPTVTPTGTVTAQP